MQLTKEFLNNNRNEWQFQKDNFSLTVDSIQHRVAIRPSNLLPVNSFFICWASTFLCGPFSANVWLSIRRMHETHHCQSLQTQPQSFPQQMRESVFRIRETFLWSFCQSDAEKNPKKGEDFGIRAHKSKTPILGRINGSEFYFMVRLRRVVCVV